MRGKPFFVIRQGSARVAAYGPNERRQFTLCYYKHAGASRSRETLTGLKNARERAQEIAIALANGRAEVLELSGPTRERHFRMEAMAAEIGIPVFDLFEQAVAAKKRLGHASIMDAVDAYQQVPTINGSRATVSFLVDDFVRRKKTAQLNGDLSEVHVKNLTDDLRRFAAEFGAREIASLGKNELQDWLNTRADRKGSIVGPRRRRHIRDRVVALFNDARDNRHLPQNSKHAAELTARPKIVKGKEPTFSPERFDLLINAAHRDIRQRRLVPAFAIGALGRMRISEIERLDWSAVHLFDQTKPGKHLPIAGEIDVSPKVAGKTGMARIIEITPSLAKWLRLYLRPSGPVLDPAIKRIDNHVRRFAAKLGIKWERNILRGSSTSYLYGLTNDLLYVASQHGTSERELKREYLERKTSEQSDRFINHIIPQESGNILELRWSIRG